jgi:hypothetical protein
MTPQAAGTRWTQEELDFIEKSIADNKPLEEITRVISIRTTGAILTKANSLGYGNYYNKTDGLTYFKDEINHKNRSCKDKDIPTKEVDPTGKEDTDSIPKIEVTLASYEGSLAFMLGSMKENRCLHL